MFGAAILSVVEDYYSKDITTPLQSGGLSEELLSRFPNKTFRRDHQAPINLFKPQNHISPSYLETLLIPCQNEQISLNDSYFRYRGYLIDPKQRRFDVLRGEQLEEPTQVLFEQLGDEERKYAIEAVSRRDKLYFPCKIEKTYHLDVLPSLPQFISDLSALK